MKKKIKMGRRRTRSDRSGVKERSMPVSISVGTEAQLDTKNGYIRAPTPPLEPYASQDGWPCLQNGACACNFAVNPLPASTRSHFPSFLLALLANSDGPDPGSSSQFLIDLDSESTSF